MCPLAFAPKVVAEMDHATSHPELRIPRPSLSLCRAEGHSGGLLSCASGILSQLGAVLWHRLEVDDSFEGPDHVNWPRLRCDTCWDLAA